MHAPHTALYDTKFYFSLENGRNICLVIYSITATSKLALSLCLTLYKLNFKKKIIRKKVVLDSLYCHRQEENLGN